MPDTLDHYQSLANEYTQRANRHASERFYLECLDWFKDCRRILDAGCGTAPLLARLRPALNVLGVDASFAMLAAGQGKTFVAAAAAERLPFSGIFDGIVCINVLEHVSNPGRVLAELGRVAEPGCRMLISTPAAEWETLLDLAERLHLKIPEGPHRFLRRAELVAAAQAGGFRVELYRRILLFPFGGPGIAKAARGAERWTPGLGFQHWLAARRI